ncbi:MAG: hypothetical protein JWM68_3839 [Verrucomicrobiales bacterium]|nr:hypothetical protein [Verrucomicrobiales bacterium]
MKIKIRWSLAVALLAFVSTRSFATEFHVGPKQKLQAVSDVPWESLKAGDQVLIDWRPEPYKEKWVICCKGTEKAPIVVRGVPGPKGTLPVIDGNGASTRKQLQFWGDVRGTIKVGGAIVPKGSDAEYIVIENLEVRGARPPFTFIDAQGQPKSYLVTASALYVEKAHHLTVRNCILTDSAHGLFVSSNNESASSDILVEGCYFSENGMEGGTQHSIYTAAIGITFQFNHLAPLRAKCVGNNLKDRSAGLVVRYNWIEAGDKNLDLVDGEDSVLVRNHPSYRKTFVYGNVFIKTPVSTHNQLVHYGGDSKFGSYYRKGTLYFYNNTIVSYRKDPMSLFWLSSDEETCDFRNNILYSTTNSKFFAVKDKGIMHLSHNFLPENWLTPATDPRGAVKDDGTSTKRMNPGFVDIAAQDFRLSAVSKCRDAGTTLLPECLPANAPIAEYMKEQQSRPRPNDGHLDIGAYEFDR